MKQIFIILFAISMVYANHIKWHGNYEKALKEAREQNKVLMVLLTINIAFQSRCIGLMSIQLYFLLIVKMKFLYINLLMM